MTIMAMWLYSFLIFFIFQLQFASSTQPFSYSLPPPSYNNHFRCPYEQSLALLHFKQNFSIDSFASRYCQSSQPKTMSWNMTTDCCKWDGVTCDGFTGQVIGLDLSCSQLTGIIPSNTTLSQLSHLKSLNLAFNDFSSSMIPYQFTQFPSLTHLNLSFSNFFGHIPSEISHLSKLVSLDLSLDSSFYIVKLEPHNLKMLLQNLTQLRELSLSSVDISSVFPMNLSSSLTLLDLSYTGLHGKLPDEVLHLPNLQTLKLSRNSNLTGRLTKANVSNSSPLKWLDLSYCNFFGAIPEWVGNLTQITRLRLSGNNFGAGRRIPSFLAKLRHLSHLSLNHINFNGPFPSSIGNLTQLVVLRLSSNSLTGAIPSSIGNLTQLVELDLSYNSLTGAIPSSIGNLTQLDWLDLSSNSLTGAIPSNIIGLQNLTDLILSNNSLNGTIPSWLFAHKSLQQLDLRSNQFSGPIEEFQRYSVLDTIYFSSNQLHGPIPHSISKLVNLEFLDLSRNNFTGTVELNMFSNLTNLVLLDLSYNKLSVSNTNIDINATLPNLSVLRLSSCKVKEFPDLLRSMQSIVVLDLRSNFLQGPLPSAICNLTFLEVLDLSHNSLGGEILQCLVNFNDQLSVLNLQMNKLHGTIPTTFAKGLRNLNFNGNQLGGKLPRSLANCRKLEVLDLGTNRLNDTFPAWLGTLPELQVLVLKSNRLHGSIPNTFKTKSPFSKLRIIDLSKNEFSGLLPSKYFRNFKAMMNVKENGTKPKYMGEDYYIDSVTVVIKGIERELVRILTVFTTIDMSNNKFEGEIPNFIGNLSSLRELNLSHNGLVGCIPPSLGKLFALESLDLSYNQLEGEIPQLLTGLTSLAVLNFSQNHLAGRIPRGNQFNTFENSSYSGNSALCGFPLSKTCGADKTLPQHLPRKPQQDEDSGFWSGFTWKVVCLGYVCGTMFGLFMGYLMFLTEKPKWLTGLVEKYQYKNAMKRGRQRRNTRRN